MAENYKDTLNLPQTSFPMRGNLVAREPERLAHWEQADLYSRILAKNRGNQSFILHDGPPFTNGHVHIGTALNKVIKDIVVRYKSARGFFTPYVPGWDCHGLPIEAKVTSELREKGKDLPAHELREACAAFSANFIETMREQFVRLGVQGDWKNEYKTMSPAYEAEVVRTLAHFVEKDLVFRSKKPVYWSIPCETALAEAEIEYKDHVSPSIWVKFRLEDPSELGLEEDASIIIWTTTPWTIPANLAIAVHPRLNYVVVKTNKGVFIVAEELIEQFVADCELEDVKTIATFVGESLENKKARHPFIDRESPVVLAEYVTTESGTGCVHTAPGHGAEDYQTGLNYGLEIYCPVDDKGRYIDDGRMPRELVGIDILETKGRSPANVAVLKLLEETGNLLQFKKLEHSYPHCWRSKTPIIFRALDQWFITLDKNNMRQKALDAIETVEWMPANGKNRIRGAVESKPDWCISRQRSWGVPIPGFFDEEKNAYIDSNVLRQLAGKFEQSGVNIWFSQSAEELLDGIDIPESWKGKRLEKGTDTLDVWIESGTSQAAVLKRHPDLSWPADLYTEGSDQHRGWFQSSLWSSLAATDQPPYRQILTHGFIVGQDGRKISKSDGKPQNSDYFIKKYGADVIRLWIASEDFRTDIPLSDEILKHIGGTYRLMRNTLRFLVSNLYDFDITLDAVSKDKLHVLDRWALHKTAEMVEACEAAYDKYEFHKVYQLVNQFCSVTLSSLYHDILKDRLYTFAANDPLRRSSQTAIHSIFNTLVRVLGPLLPFTSDEAWSYFTNDSDFSEEPLILQGWPSDAKDWANAALDEEFSMLLDFRDKVNEKLEELRASGEIGRSLDAYLEVSGNQEDATFATLSKYDRFLEELLIVSRVTLTTLDQDDLKISVSQATGGRCPRCWRWEPLLLNGTENEQLCPRCEEALKLTV